VFSLIFITVLVIGVFAIDLGKRWWQENEWRRKWRRRPADDD
jgi:hypothetical protein